MIYWISTKTILYKFECYIFIKLIILTLILMSFGATFLTSLSNLSPKPKNHKHWKNYKVPEPCDTVIKY